MSKRYREFLKGFNYNFFMALDLYHLVKYYRDNMISSNIEMKTFRVVLKIKSAEAGFGYSFEKKQKGELFPKLNCDIF